MSFLGFDDTEDLPTHTKGIIGGSSISRVFLNGDAVARAERSVRIKRKYFPPGSLELRVDEALPRRTLGKTRNFGASSTSISQRNSMLRQRKQYRRSRDGLALAGSLRDCAGKDPRPSLHSESRGCRTWFGCRRLARDTYLRIRKRVFSPVARANVLLNGIRHNNAPDSTAHNRQSISHFSSPASIGGSFSYPLGLASS